MKPSPNTGLTFTQLKLFFCGVLMFFKIVPYENAYKHWSWFWVTTPLWIFDVALILIAILLMSLGGWIEFIKNITNKDK